jgi:hypothetical protein
LRLATGDVRDVGVQLLRILVLDMRRTNAT